MEGTCVDVSFVAAGIAHLIQGVGTLIDYKLQRTTSYDPATGEVTKIETAYKDIPGIVMSDIVGQQGGGLDVSSSKGIVAMSAIGLDFYPSPGDLMEIPAASVRGAAPYKVVRVTENSPTFIQASAIQYTLTWQLA